MLTSDLVAARVRKGVVEPRYVDPTSEESLGIAEALVGIFDASRGETRGALRAELDAYLGSGTDYLFHRGLAKLLLDRCEFETRAILDPPELRRRVFERAARAMRDDTATWDPRSVLPELAHEVDADADAIDDGLFADLKEEQRLKTFEPISPGRLLERYNTALAQAVLFRATELRVEVRGETPKRYRELFRSIKFHQLLHRVEGSARHGYTIILDGPLSLFSSSQRYGLQMASFLPTLIALRDWSLRAEVTWGPRRTRCILRLGHETGLVSHRTLRGQYQPEEMAWFTAQFEKLASDWAVTAESEVVDLGGQGVLIPDYVFAHSSGAKAYMEVFGYWRRSAVATRAKLLAAHGPPRIILALSKELHGEKDSLDELPAEIYLFRTQPIAREVLAILRGFEPGGP